MEKFTQAFKAYAKASGADLVGVASIDRFEGVLPQHDPRLIFPEAKSVVVVGRRITRGTLRGLEEGTQFQNYTLYGYNWLDNRFVAITTFRTAEYLEDNGWEAVPLVPLPPDIPPMGISVKPDLPPPNVLVNIEHAAVCAGLGEIGYAGFFLSPQFGPRQRLQAILTDAELEPDPIFEGELCDGSPEEHAALCPLGAISADQQQVLEICGKKMVVGEIDYAKCRECENGAKTNLYYPAANPDRLGAVCARSCVARLEEAGKVGNQFQSPFRKREPWAVVSKRVFSKSPIDDRWV